MKLFIYGKVGRSLTADLFHISWILVQKDLLHTLTCSCSRIACTSLSCNHVTAVMYKIDYAYQKRYLDKACPDIPCNWNQGTKKDVQPKMLCGIK